MGSSKEKNEKQILSRDCYTVELKRPMELMHAKEEGKCSAYNDS